MSESFEGFSFPTESTARSDDRWLYPWGLAYAAIGAASLLVPLYALRLGGDASLVGLLAGTGALAGVPGGLLAGRIAAERANRRGLLVASLVALVASLSVLPLIAEPWLLLAPNAVVWLVVGTTTPVLNLAIIQDRPESEWSGRISRLNAAQGYGWVGGLLAGTGWIRAAPGDPIAVHRSFFALSVGAVLVATPLVWWWFPGADRPLPSPRRLVAAVIDPATTRRYDTAVSPYGFQRAYWRLSAGVEDAFRCPESALRMYFLATFLFFTGFAVFFGPLPAYLTAIGLGSGDVFLLFVASSGATAVFYAWTESLGDRGTTARVHASALVVRAVALPVVPLVVGFTRSFGALLAVFAVIGAAWSVIVVTATRLVAQLSPAELRGEAFGGFTALSGMGTAIGSVLGGGLAVAVGYAAMFLVAFGLVVAGAALTLAAWRHTAIGDGSPDGGPADGS